MKTIPFAIVLVLLCACTTATYRYLNEDLVLYRAGERFYEKAEYTKAAASFKSALQKGFANEGILPRLGRALLESGDLPEASLVYKELFELHRNVEEALMIAGMSVEQESFDVAIELYGIILEYDPRYRPALMGLARVFVRVGRFEEAIDLYREVLRET